jgi:hypothetical protein
MKRVFVICLSYVSGRKAQLQLSNGSVYLVVKGGERE